MKYSIKQPAALNEIGQRENNEDSIYPKAGEAHHLNHFFLVCDGVGGAEKGEVASATVCKTMAAYLLANTNPLPDETLFINAFEEAQLALDAYLADHPAAAGMATTLTLLSLHDNGAFIAWCGDSRVYQIRNGNIVFKTDDHSFVAELVRGGIITPEQAKTHPQKNMITRAMQGHGSKTVVPDVFHQTDVRSGDVFFLCSDGVLESVEDEQLCEIFSASEDMNAAMSRIKEMCSGQSRDNFSAYAVQIDQVDGVTIEQENSENDALMVQAKVIEEHSVKKTKSKQHQKREWSLFARIGLVVLLLGIVFAIYYVGIRKPSGTDKTVANDSTKTETVKRPTAEEQIARINSIIEFTEQNTIADLSKKVDDLDSLCQWLEQAKVLYAELSKKSNEAKKKSMNNYIDRIVEFNNPSGLNVENFKAEANKLKP